MLIMASIILLMLIILIVIRMVLRELYVLLFAIVTCRLLDLICRLNNFMIARMIVASIYN